MPHLSRHHLSEIIAERTLTLPESKMAHEVAAYLLAERHTAQLEPLMRDIMLWRQEHGVVEATVVSAHEVPERVLTDITSILREHYPHTKTVILETKLDPSLIGGVRVDLARDQLDMSIQAKLNKFKRLTTEGA